MPFVTRCTLLQGSLHPTFQLSSLLDSIPQDSGYGRHGATTCRYGKPLVLIKEYFFRHGRAHGALLRVPVYQFGGLGHLPGRLSSVYAPCRKAATAARHDLQFHGKPFVLNAEGFHHHCGAREIPRIPCTVLCSDPQSVDGPTLSGGQDARRTLRN